jgi:AmmeMemoRadiSam system protein A
LRDGAERSTLSAEEGARLVAIARASIAHALRTGQPLEVAGDGLPPALREPRACFVTLRLRDGSLRGCIGDLEARQPLADAVADRACAAAFRDPRFAPLAAEELERVVVDVSVLGPLAPIDARSEAAIADALRPGVDGLLIDDGRHRATFLPSVWESLPEPARFLEALWRKAGLPPRHVPPALRAWRYGVEEFAEA